MVSWFLFAILHTGGPQPPIKYHHWQTGGPNPPQRYVQATERYEARYNR